jgi:hypothetical protein
MTDLTRVVGNQSHLSILPALPAHFKTSSRVKQNTLKLNKKKKKRQYQ